MCKEDFDCKREGVLVSVLVLQGQEEYYQRPRSYASCAINCLGCIFMVHCRRNGRWVEAFYSRVIKSLYKYFVPSMSSLHHIRPPAMHSAFHPPLHSYMHIPSRLRNKRNVADPVCSVFTFSSVGFVLVPVHCILRMRYRRWVRSFVPSNTRS